ncbi:MAG TPA: choice-of-anchor J domain-containing protein [Flavobacterium sp.]|nr:choice-of-anchor J domain-containing protein [Flavobacterium sp.]
MIKKFLLFFLLVIAISAQSQFIEDFNTNLFPPLGWTTFSNVAGNPTWTSTDGTPFQGMSGAGAFANRQNVGAGNTSEDWLVTPPIALTGDGMVTMFSRQTLAGDQGTLYQIRLSTTSQNIPGSFTTVATWTETEIFGGGNLADFSQQTVSLSGFVGQTVYIAFVRVYTQPSAATNGDRWIVDDVNISGNSLLLNNIHGTLSYGTTAADCNIPINNNYIPATISVNGAGIYTTSTGSYNLNSLNTDVTIVANMTNPNFTISPLEYTFNFSGTGNSETANFCITPNGVHPDLEISMLPVTNTLPGGHPFYHLSYQNAGTTIQSGSVSLVFDDGVLDLLSASPVAVQTGNVLTWNFSDLYPLETGSINLQMQVSLPTDVPPVNIGDTLNFTAAIASAATDETPANNTSTISQAVVASLDPNDKIVQEGEFITPEQAGDYLHYIIRFQNTGTAAASKVAVKDLLEDNLDASTLQVISGSHPFTRISNGKQTDFVFENINLPTASENEAESHGFVAFKVKPTAGLAIGNVIENHASIYFDYNFPIITNTTSTTIAVLKTAGFDANDAIVIYPNPVKEILKLETQNTIIERAEIYNNLGQLLLSASELKQGTIDVSHLPVGTYFINLYSKDGKTVRKFIKL